MDVDQRQEGEVTVLALKGAFETVDLPGFSHLVKGLLDHGTSRLCLNLSEVEFLNSTALGYLVVTHHKLSERGGRMALSAAPKRVAMTIRTLGLGQMFDLFDDDADAVRQLQE